MFKIQEIREMIKLVDDSSIEVFEIEEGNSKILIRRSIGTAPVVQKGINTSDTQTCSVNAETTAVLPSYTNKEISTAHVQVAAKTENLVKVNNTQTNDENKHLSKIVSPMVGTFYRAPGVDAAPFVKIGDKVEKSTMVCILEAMKLFNEIEAEMDGEIVEVLVENGQLVEYGQPLFLVKQTS
ncbi:acetyl-CoA carboxylase biotin carboxyl carrier protein [Bacillus sp. ISL-7]|uniref:acetyl-CoA carboxylase biotin carboxyl carrier protein n=1 Tax=Bacillus sp. ISL-7 TaxID=2819136 RepID=UPI001BE91E28|nr:acetyl-CoA carboxylase biotin carboxyl carrier protein [Bacillus sp. ISL-7]MBT2737284.1 acetyl-CoA carboxylase biotin carboxyl carrier protein [Bacillus sp. ISL-7]